jgi:hypothetical protein
MRYTIDELTVEYLENALETDVILTDADGELVEVEEKGGTTVFKTGFDEWDEEEKAWAEQESLEELGRRYWETHVEEQAMGGDPLHVIPGGIDVGR